MEFSVIYMYADYATDGFYIDYSIPEKRTKVIVDSFAKLPGESSSTNTRLLQLVQL